MSERAASAVVAQYLAAFAGSDLDRARGLLADDFAFRGPGMQRAVDRETFLSTFGGKYDHVSDVRVLRQAETTVTSPRCTNSTPAHRTAPRRF